MQKPPTTIFLQVGITDASQILITKGHSESHAKNCDKIEYLTNLPIALQL